MRMKAILGKWKRVGRAAMAIVLFALSCGESDRIKITPGLFELCFVDVDQDDLRPMRTGTPDQIPRRLGPWESFGFFVEGRSSDAFKLYTVIQLPSKPERLGSQWSKYSLEEAVTGMKSDETKIVGGKLVSFGLDPDDPLGVYTVSVFVDGEEIRKLRFHVSEVERDVYVGERPRRCDEAGDAQ